MRSVLWGLLLSLVPVVTQAQPASAPSKAPAAGRQLTLIFTGDLYGRYAWPGCEKRDKEHAELSHLIGAAKALRQRATAAGKARPITLMGGSAIRPDILGNFIFKEAPALAPRVAELFSRIAFDAISVGLFDFGAAPEALRRYGQAMKKEGLALLAGNVRCEASDDPRCAALGAKDGRRYLVIERGGLKVGVFSVVRGDLAKRILQRSGKGLKAVDPVAWSRETIGALRKKERVDVVVALANLNLESDAPEPVLDYLRALGHDGPDLVLANGMFERASRSGYLRQIRRGRSVVLGTDRFGQHLGEAVVTLGAKGVDKVEVRQHAVAEHAPDPKAKPLLDTMIRELCKTTNRALGRGTFTKPLTYTAALRYLMEVMRKRTRAEVAVINDSAIADTSFPMKGQLTWEQLLRALRTESHVGHVQVLGKQLIKHFGKHVVGADSGLNVMGMEKKGRFWRINGRPLVSGQMYRVAITAFVAGGGDGLIKLKATEGFEDVGVSLRDMTTDFFGANGQAEHDGDADIDLEKDFPDLGDRWVLYGDFDLGFSLSNVSIKNGPAVDRYSLPLLRRDDVTSLSAKLGVALGASTRGHALELDLALAYGQTWTTLMGEDETNSAESVDRITANFIYKLRALRAAHGSRWYVPEPYAEGRFVTEFTASGACDPTICLDTEDQTYRYLDVGGVVGVGFTLHPKLFVKAGFAFRGEVVPEEKNPEIPAEPGIYLGYLLRRWKIIASPIRPVELESRLDFYFTDFGGELRRELTLESKLYLSLTRRIAFTVGHRLYAFATRSRETSFGNDVQLGLALRWDFRRQTF